MRKIAFLVIASTFCLGTSVFAQSTQSSDKDLGKLPIPPSPNASALAKFGDIPVGLSTGIPTIGIPFFNYKDASSHLELNVSLSYHAGGHRVEDMASNVGLGWALSAGGAISRTVRGRPDDMLNGYINSGTLPLFNTEEFDYMYTEANASTPISKGICQPNSSSYHTMKDVTDNQLDGECDIFSFNIAGMSGKFFFRKDGQIQLLAQSNLKISYSVIGSAIQKFIITNDRGVQYHFDKREITETVSSLPSSPTAIMPAYTSSWYIGKIVSADGKNEIRFNYIETTLEHEASFSMTFRNCFRLLSNGAGLSPYYNPNLVSGSFQSVITNALRISSINFPDGSSVEFNYNFSRLDYAGDKALTAVVIKDQYTERQFNLQYGYFETTSCSSSNACQPGLPYSVNDFYKRLKLLSVQEVHGTTSLTPYRFEYNPTALPTRNTKFQDWWGYYNGNDHSEVPPPIEPINGIPAGYSMFDSIRSSEKYAKAWVLEKIHYPTGGNTRFYFELNDGYRNGIYARIGGLRVKSTEDFDPTTGKFQITAYTYKTADNVSSGRMHVLPQPTVYWNTLYHRGEDQFEIPWKEFVLTQNANPTQTLSNFNGSPVIYTRVKVEKSGVVYNGYTVHEFTGFYWPSVQDNHHPRIQVQALDWNQGLPLKEIVYDANGVKLKAIEHEYQYFDNYATATDANSRNLVTALMFSDDAGTPAAELYGSRTYSMVYGRAELKKTMEKVFVGGDSLQTVTNYTYDPTYYLLTKSKTWSSKGYPSETKLYYPFNYNASVLLRKEDLLTANRVGEVIAAETWEEIGGVNYLKRGVVTDYSSYTSSGVKPSRAVMLETDRPVPESVVGPFNPNQLFRQNSFKDKVQFLSYDNKGRVTEIKSPEGMPSSMVWGIRNDYPVAVFSNALLNEVAYTSFEDSVFGGWTLQAGSTILNTGGVTGGKSLNGGVSAGVILGNYTITAWSKATINVNGQAGQLKRHAGLWDLYEWQLSNLSSITITGSNFDEVRLYPQNAQVTTYTYQPLKGLIAQCDINNLVMYYEYDGFGRLFLLRDANDNILKKYCYNYQGQLQNCTGANTAPVWQPTGLVSCKPCPQNSMYSSSFSQREEKDVNPNSSTYNSLRYVDDGTGVNCVAQADWQVISTSCEVSGGQYTGNQFVTKQDKNPCSPTYNSTATSTIQNHSTCPPPGCNTNNCTGVDKRCVNGDCQTGIKVYTACVYNESTGMYDCTYHYEWSDNSWSQNYYESSPIEVPVN